MYLRWILSIINSTKIWGGTLEKGDSKVRTIQKFLFYMSSFMPLYLLLCVQNIKVFDKNKKFSSDIFCSQFNFSNIPQSIFWWGLIVFVFISLFGCILFFFIYTKKDGIISKLEDAEFVREDTMGYIVTYIVPLITMDIYSPRSLIVNFVLFIVIGTFYVKNDQIFMNPVYNLFSYNVFSTEKGIYITKISKQKLRSISKHGLEVRKVNILADIYVLKEADNKPISQF